MSSRTKRVGEEIKKVISERLVRGLKDPVPGFVTIQEVDVNRDFSRAKVYFSVFGSEEQREEANEVLNSYAKFFRSEVNRAIRLRNSPEIIFIDDTPDHACIHALLSENNDSDQEAEDRPSTETENDSVKRTLFGTDGIRGKANHHPMTAGRLEWVRPLKVVVKTGALGRSKQGHRRRIVIGKDTLVLLHLEQAVATICSMGVDAADGGLSCNARHCLCYDSCEPTPVVISASQRFPRTTELRCCPRRL